MQWNQTECRPLATSIYNLITQNRPELPTDRAMTVKQMVGHDTWSELEPAEQRFAGRFVSACVHRGMLNLSRERKDCSNHWRYRPKPKY